MFHLKKQKATMVKKSRNQKFHLLLVPPQGQEPGMSTAYDPQLYSVDF